MIENSPEPEDRPAESGHSEDPSKSARRGFLGRGARAGIGLVALTVHHRRSLADTIDISSPEACASMGGNFRIVNEVDSATGATYSFKVCDRPTSLGIFPTPGSTPPPP